MKTWEFHQKVTEYRRLSGNEREGQSLYNVAHTCFNGEFMNFPEWGQSGGLDPFYNDSHCEAFLHFLAEKGYLEE